MSNNQNHYDLKTDDKHLGRLYIFPVEDPKMLSNGIKSQWFLTHQSLGAILSGYVNEADQWSLSPPFSLEPKNDYQERNKLFDFVFQEEFVSSLKQIDYQGAVQQQTSDLSVLNNDKPDADDSTFTEEAELEIAPSEEIVPTEINISKSPPLNTLIEKQEGENMETKDATSVDNNLNFLEAQRKQLEEMLVFLIVNSLIEEEKNLSSSSLWFLNESQGIKYLIDKKDNHVVLAVDETGNIFSSLNIEDAIIVAKLIEELDTKEELEEISDDLLPPVNMPHSQSISSSEIQLS